MEVNLQGKVSIITGAGRGIGRSTATALAKFGSDIVAVDLRGEDLKKTVEEIKSLGKRCWAITSDMTQEAQVQEMVQKSIAEFGKIDILVNNVGYFHFKPFLEIDLAYWQRIMDINLTSAFLCVKNVAPHMVSRKYGKIVNFSSTAGKTGSPGVVAYNAAKHGIIGFTRGLAAEFAPYGINVNAVCPGIIQTPLHFEYYENIAETIGKERDVLREERKALVPLKRFGQPEEVAHLIAFLVSDDASYITGQSYNIDGGIITH